MAERQTKQPGKRMRLGTKSCSECRRRKIKCVFPQGHSVCQSCALHDTLCNAQQPRTQLNEPSNDGNPLQQRVNELERLVKSLAESVRVATALDVDLEGNTTQNESSSGRETGGLPAEHSFTATKSSDAPLINLFQAALLISDDDGRIQDMGGKPGGSAGTLVGELSTKLSPYIPDETTVRSILRMTQNYWCTWPTCYYGSDLHQPFHGANDSECEDYIVGRLFNQHLDASFCTVLSWFALCIQQLPMDWFRYGLPNTLSKQDLLMSYLAYCKLILAGADEDNLDTVQCHVLRFKLYINMGMPQKAWACIRGAISTATLLGMHRLDIDASESHKMIWLQSWVAERQLSLVLGYPSSVQMTTKTSFGQLPMALEGSVALRITYALASVFGDVINRDQARANKSYAATMRIEEDVEELRQLFPVQWWDSSIPCDSLGDFYYQEVAKFFYFLLVKLVHLPYMLKSIHDARYEYSRQSALDAAREQIRCYVRLRNFPGAEVLVCEIMDFNVFSAGMALIIGTLYMPGFKRDLLSVWSEDGCLIESLIASLRKTSMLLECPVAEQGARVLELLIDTCQPRGDEPLQLSVPYFGKLKIQLPKSNIETGSAPCSVAQPSSTCGPKDYDFSSSATSATTVEFSTNEFAASIGTQFERGDELRQDWFGVIDSNTSYDWEQTLTRMQIDT